MRNNKSNKGFTLIELLIVIAIIGILAAVLIPNLLSARQRANTTAGQAYVRNVATEMEANRGTTGTFAEDLAGDCEDQVENVPGAIDTCTIALADEGLNYRITATLQGASEDNVWFDGESGILATDAAPWE